VLEREWPPFVAVTSEAAGVIASKRTGRSGADGPVWIVAIDAAHRVLRQPMMRGFLELHPDVCVTTRALLVDRGRLSCHHSSRAVGMNLVAGRARDLILGVARLQPPDMRRLIEMAREADLVGGGRGKLRRIANISCRNRFGVLLCRPVT